ncbi:MAG: hypothetical protein FJX60_19140 [Alphaproteobacteria bacterium]|nr:hypothetical protein [Alphaproteobacteria bacterium]
MADAGNMPWSIKGVSAEARKIAKSAAMVAGEPMGVWLSRVINAASAARLGQATQVAVRQEAPVPAPAELRVDIEALTQRLARAERRMLESLQPLDQALAQIGRRLEALEAPALPPPEPNRPRGRARY